MTALDRLRELAQRLAGLTNERNKVAPAAPSVLDDLQRTREELLHARDEAEAMLAVSSGEVADRLAVAIQHAEQKLAEVQLHIGRLERIGARTDRAKAISARVRELSEAFSVASEGRRQEIRVEIEALQHELAALRRDGDAERELVGEGGKA